MRTRPASWLDQAVGVCFSLLVAAAAVYIAVRLIEAVWTVLVVILSVTAFVAIGVAILRFQRQRW
jgi:thiol:disulfide interchange protein